MATTVRNRFVIATVVAASALLLTGCAPVPNTPTADFPGFPEGVDVESDAPTGEPQAAWIGIGNKIAITIFGSSTCPFVGSAIHVEKQAGEGNAVSIEVPPLPEQPCTMDLVPHTTEFWTPQDVTTTEPLEITVLEQTIVLSTKEYKPAEGEPAEDEPEEDAEH